MTTINGSSIHYFPGHMKKALDSLSGFVKGSDLVIEIADSRAPVSSRNPMLMKIIGAKPHLLFLSKSDFADPSVTGEWSQYLAAKGIVAFSGNLTKERIISKLVAASNPLVEGKRVKERKLGMKPQPLRLLVVGIPNVGKSTFINNIAGKEVAKVANRPGVTRAEQWIKISKDFILLDTPGILPMNYPDGAEAVRLSLIGSIKEEVLPIQDLAYALIGYLRQEYSTLLERRYDVKGLGALEPDMILKTIAQKRGFLEKGGVPDEERASLSLLKEFQNGVLGRITLESPSC